MFCPAQDVTGANFPLSESVKISRRGLWDRGGPLIDAKESWPLGRRRAVPGWKRSGDGEKSQKTKPPTGRPEHRTKLSLAVLALRDHITDTPVRLWGRMALPIH